MPVDICRLCQGVWLDPGELQLLSKTFKAFDLRATPKTFLRWRPILPCPCCDGSIVLWAHGGLGERVEIGRCDRCSGLWLNQWQLQRFQNPRAAPREPQFEERIWQVVRPDGLMQWIVAETGLVIDIDNPCVLIPYVTWTVIALNVLVFVLSLLAPNKIAFALAWGDVPSAIRNGEVFRLVTALFLHADVGHLAGNLFFLHTFGDNLEERFGGFRFTLLYFTCGISAGLISCVFLSSELPRIGASGAISGVMGAYLVAFPRKHVLVGLGPLLRVRVLTFLMLWIVLNVIGWILQLEWIATAVDSSAHLGGFLTGLLTGYLLVRERKATTVEA